MRTVMRSQDVAEAWARQSQYSARNGKDTLKFQGATIYSYGSHYPLARIVGGVALVNSSHYSKTTSVHAGMAKSAARKAGLKCFDTRDPLSSDWSGVLAGLLETRNSVLASAPRSPMGWRWFIRWAISRHYSAEEFASIFYLPALDRGSFARSPPARGRGSKHEPGHTDGRVV